MEASSKAHLVSGPTAAAAAGGVVQCRMCNVCQQLALHICQSREGQRLFQPQPLVCEAAPLGHIVHMLSIWDVCLYQAHTCKCFYVIMSTIAHQTPAYACDACDARVLARVTATNAVSYTEASMHQLLFTSSRHICHVCVLCCALCPATAKAKFLGCTVNRF